jgi:hypothetical protein
MFPTAVKHLAARSYLGRQHIANLRIIINRRRTGQPPGVVPIFVVIRRRRRRRHAIIAQCVSERHGRQTIVPSCTSGRLRSSGVDPAVEFRPSGRDNRSKNVTGGN